jgi:hypothetical protein
METVKMTDEDEKASRNVEINRYLFQKVLLID